MMTENEIIEYLKGNQEKGVAFCFMPQEAQDWCKKHKNENIFRLFGEESWVTLNTAIDCVPGNIYCLNSDYEPKPQFEPHWEEFSINKDGMFFIIGDDGKIHHYHWWNWVEFLNHHCNNFNNFGGWVYEDPISEDGKKAELLVVSPRFLSSRILKPSGLTSCILFNRKDELKPAYPTKILFWRYKE